MSDQANIFSFGNEHEKLQEEKLRAYLEGCLSAIEQHEVEQWLSDEGMEADALEGLREINTADMQQSVERLKYQIKKQTTGNLRKKKSPYADNRWTIIAVILILILCILGYLVLHFSFPG